MAPIDDALKAALRVRAALKGRSTEEELRSILRQALQCPIQGRGLGQRLARRFEAGLPRISNYQSARHRVKRLFGMNRDAITGYQRDLRSHASKAVQPRYWHGWMNKTRVSAINHAEIALGIALLPDGLRKQGLLPAALAMFAEEFAGRSLPFDDLAADRYAMIVAIPPAPTLS